MARPISWLPRLTQIAKAVAGSQRSHYGRRDLELLLGVGAKAAGRMLEALATDRAGSSHLVARETLMSFLTAARDADDVSQLVATTKAEKDHITRTRARHMHLRDEPDLRGAGLPENIDLERGELRIRFADGADLVSAMLRILQLLDQEPVEFAARYELESQETAEAAEARWYRQETARLAELQERDSGRGRVVSSVRHAYRDETAQGSEDAQDAPAAGAGQ